MYHKITPSNTPENPSFLIEGLSLYLTIVNYRTYNYIKTSAKTARRMEGLKHKAQ